MPHGNTFTLTVMRIRSVISLISLCIGFVFARATDGSTAYNFLDVTSSSHIYGLGGVNISIIEDDINVIDQNPALLGPEIERQLGVDYMRYLGESNFAGVKYGMAAGDHGAWAAGIKYFGYGSMKSADETGNVTGTFKIGRAHV